MTYRIETDELGYMHIREEMTLEDIIEIEDIRLETDEDGYMRIVVE